MGEGIAFIKLWPLNPKTGERSSSLRTGFPAPTVAELASRVSASGRSGGACSLDIEMIVAKSRAAAVGEDVTGTVPDTRGNELSPTDAGAAGTGAEELEASATVNSMVADTLPGPADAVIGGQPAGSQARCAGDDTNGVDQCPSVAGADVENAEGSLAERLGATGESGNDAPHTGIRPSQHTSPGSRNGGSAEHKARQSPATASRWLALEVEVNACGSINVPHVMDLIKVCFEQVRRCGRKSL